MRWVEDGRVDGEIDGQDGGVVNQAAPGLDSQGGARAATRGGDAGT